MRVTKIFQQLVRSRDVRAAWAVAIAADAIQIIGLPLFVVGGISPADTMVDIAAAVVLSSLIGWHWAFIPSLIAELLPGLDLFPTWTAAVAYVTWERSRSKEDVRDIRDVRDVTNEQRMPGTRPLQS